MKDMGKLRWALGLCAVLGVAALGVACDDDGGDDSPDAAVDGKVSDTAVDVAKVSTFGSACTTNAECTGVVDYCAKQPNSTTGLCTKKDCNTLPANTCPAGTQCYNAGPLLSPPQSSLYICIYSSLIPKADGGTDGGTDAGGDASTDAQHD